MTRIPALDGLRAIAILAVLGYHFGHSIPGGYLGVDLFFVLSGFLITSVLLRAEAQACVSLRNFYIRRALRILPPLFASVALAFAIYAWRRPEIVPTLFFYANFVPPENLGPLQHTWSLSVEEQFYLAWPLGFLLLGRWRLAALLAVVAGACWMRVLVYDDGWTYADIYRNSFARADGLGVGCMAAIVWERWPDACHKVLGHRWTLPICLGAIFGFFWLARFRSAVMIGPLLTVFEIVCGLGVLAAVLEPTTWTQRLLSCQPMRYIGSRSYGIYLYHFPLIIPASLWFPEYPLGHRVLAYALTFLIAEVSYQTIELPSRLGAFVSPNDSNRSADSSGRLIGGVRVPDPDEFPVPNKNDISL